MLRMVSAVTTLLALGGTALGAESTMPGLFPVRQFGAVGDGLHDDTEAFRRAVAAAKEVGGTVVVDPVIAGGGYVLTGTIRLDPAVSLVGAPAGMPFFAWEGVPREQQTGAVILARPRPEDYTGERKQPLFELGGGNTVRGLYILYDEQPWPSDEQFDDPASPYHYDSLDELRERFVRDHARPYGPTFYARHGAVLTIEDITCGRYYDFCVFHTAGKAVIQRCYLYGVKRAFAIQHGPDVVRISSIHIVPNVERPISREHSKLHAAITHHEDNIAFDFGNVDGYSVRDVAVYLAHTGIKLGADESAPFYNPVTGERVSFPWGRGPWGAFQDVKLDNVTLGFRCVVGTILPNQLDDVMIHVSLPAKETVETTEGPVARQAAFYLQPNFAGATLQVSNLSLSSFAPRSTHAAAQMVHQANGRAFLLDCPGIPEKQHYADRREAHLTIHDLVVSNILDSHMVGRTAGTASQVWVSGFTHNGVRRRDGLLEAGSR